MAIIAAAGWVTAALLSLYIVRAALEPKSYNMSRNDDVVRLVVMARQILQAPNVVTAAGLAQALHPFDKLDRGDPSYPDAFKSFDEESTDGG
jgi:hypothetical protein